MLICHLEHKMFLMVYWPGSSWCLGDFPDSPDNILKWIRQIHWVPLTNYNVISNTYIHLPNWEILFGYPSGLIPEFGGRSWTCWWRSWTSSGFNIMSLIIFFIWNGLGLVPSSTPQISEWWMISEGVTLWWHIQEQHTHHQF